MLSQLCAEYFQRSPVLAWPIFALGLFLVVFVTVTVRAWRRHPADVQRMAELPLQDSQEVTRHG